MRYFIKTILAKKVLLMFRMCIAFVFVLAFSIGSVNTQALTCSVAENVWPGGYNLTVRVKNDTVIIQDGWAVSLEYGSLQNITNSWGASLSTTGSTVVASHLSWNKVLYPGQDATFGFEGVFSGSFVVPVCTINGLTPTSTPTPTLTPTTMPTPLPSSSSSSSSSSTGSSSGSVIPNPFPSLAPTPEIGEEETYFYLSYDDSASTAPRDLTFAALANGSVPDPSYGRPYEFLNAEEFEHFAPEDANPFTISMGLIQVPQTEIPIAIEYEGDMFALGVNITGPTLTKEERKNVVLTLLLDVSGSMGNLYGQEVSPDIRTLLDVATHGLKKIVESLKPGDVLNLVTFETVADEVLTGWLFDENDSTYLDAVNMLVPQGSTNLNEGIELAYSVANATFDQEKANRVIILTDAYANTGQIDPEIIASHTVINGAEGILFSGIGVGATFNEAFLNELTDIGKSTYSAMVTPKDAKRIFTSGFMRFVDHAVENIRFRVDYPQSLDQLKSAAEDVSTEEGEVSTVNYAYNSSQFFLEMFSSDVEIDYTETIKLTATFDGENGENHVIIEKTLEELLGVDDSQIFTAAAVSTLADLVAENISCEEVMLSGLYQKMIDSELFDTYIQAITDYCDLREGVLIPTGVPTPTVPPFTPTPTGIPNPVPVP